MRKPFLLYNILFNRAGLLFISFRYQLKKENSPKKTGRCKGDFKPDLKS